MSGESGLARGGGDAESPLLPAGSEETACGLPQVFERSVGCFTRYSMAFLAFQRALLFSRTISPVSLSA